MKVYPRSHWTAVNPSPIMMADEFEGLPYYAADAPPVGVTFHRPNEDMLFLYRNPIEELERLRKQAVSGTGVSDINYNFAISQNTAGVYVLRGNVTKCVRTNTLRVLMLLGTNEDPTDLLKKNQQDFLNTELINPYPVSPLSLGDSNVHVFNLIEFLADKGLYSTRNDGMFGPFCRHAVMKLQHSLGLNLTGEYSMWVINALDAAERQYIPLLPPVG